MEKVRLTAEQETKLDLLIGAANRFHDLFTVYRIIADNNLWPEQETALLLKVAKAESIVKQRKEELFTIEGGKENGNDER